MADSTSVAVSTVDSASRDGRISRPVGYLRLILSRHSEKVAQLSTGFMQKLLRTSRCSGNRVEVFNTTYLFNR